jgi:CRISPR-associated protein Csm3
MSARDPANFDRLTRRVRITGVITSQTGLRVGAGKGGNEDAVDLPVLRDADGFPFIPGASIKGVLRSTLESLLPGSRSDGAAFWACNPLDEKQNCGYHESGKRSDVQTNRHCTVCALFGSHVVASHVRFSDAMVLERDMDKPIPVGRRDGVAIDRDLKSARDKTKYDFQVVPPGTRFSLEVFADNVDDVELGLLKVAIDQLDEGFAALGGFTSRGLGRVSVRVSEVLDIDPRQVLHTAALPSPVVEKDLEPLFAKWQSAVATTSAKGA